MCVEYTVEDVVRRLGLRPATVRAYARRGLIPAVKLEKSWRFPRRKFEEWMEKRLLPQREMQSVPDITSPLLLSEAHLLTGMEWFQTKTNWGDVFHNDLYSKLRKLSENGINEEWWRNIVNHLWDWRAIRPFPKKIIQERGSSLLPQIEKEYNRVIATEGREPELGEVQWDALAPLYQICASIKPTKNPSPVFGSKLAHFLIPTAFPVFDRQAVGGFEKYPDYGAYWNACREAWISTPPETRAVLTETLRERIERTGGGVVPDYYPFATKSVELCIIGAQHVKSAAPERSDSDEQDDFHLTNRDTIPEEFPDEMSEPEKQGEFLHMLNQGELTEEFLHGLISQDFVGMLPPPLDPEEQARARNTLQAIIKLTQTVLVSLTQGQYQESTLREYHSWMNKFSLVMVPHDPIYQEEEDYYTASSFIEKRRPPKFGSPDWIPSAGVKILLTLRHILLDKWPVRQCAAQRCQKFFWDLSDPGTRRYCSGSCAQWAYRHRENR